MNRETILQHVQINQARMQAIVEYIDQVVSELREDLSKLDLKNQALLTELQCKEKKSSESISRPEDFCLTPLYIRVKRVDPEY